MKRISQIRVTDQSAYAASKRRWDSIAKPLGSFGELEAMISKLAAVQGTEIPDISQRSVVVLCADHGVVAEGVTQTDSSVTARCAEAIASGTSNVNVIADSVGCEVLVVDMGIKEAVSHPNLLNRNIAHGTRNFTKEAAMSRSECERALTIGIDLVHDLKSHGSKLILTGEMGIGNTTPTAALASVLLNVPPEIVTGRGAGLRDEGLKRKINAVKHALTLHSCSVDDPLGMLASLGGFEIAGMVGLYLGAAYYQIPIVIDGVISAVAACMAQAFSPLCTQYMFASHCSGEPAGQGLLALLGLHPIIQAGLRLGEGTGALLLLPLLDSALALYQNSHSFDSLQIKPYEELS